MSARGHVSSIAVGTAVGLILVACIYLGVVYQLPDGLATGSLFFVLGVTVGVVSYTWLYRPGWREVLLVVGVNGLILTSRVRLGVPDGALQVFAWFLVQPLFPLLWKDRTKMSMAENARIAKSTGDSSGATIAREHTKWDRSPNQRVFGELGVMTVGWLVVLLIHIVGLLPLGPIGSLALALVPGATLAASLYAGRYRFGRREAGVLGGINLLAAAAGLGNGTHRGLFDLIAWFLVESWLLHLAGGRRSLPAIRAKAEEVPSEQKEAQIASFSRSPGAPEDDN